MAELEGKVVVVTGGSRGIGRAIAKAVAQRGAAVVLAARTAEAVEDTVAKLGQAGTVEGKVCDVRRPEDCRRLIDETVADFGRIDVLVNNAGVGARARVDELSVDDWQRVIETNLNGVFYCSRAAIPPMRAAGSGWIINIGSLAGKNAYPGGAAYNASKFGLIGFSEALMQDVRHDGIRVAYIMPGSVATDFGGRFSGDGTGDDWKLQPEDVARTVTDLLAYPNRALPSRIELRPSQPPKR